MTIEQRFRALYKKIEGAREQRHFELTYERTPEEKRGVTPINKWHNRILSELDFCLQLKAHTDKKVSAPIEMALHVLEEGIATEGVATDEVCQQAEQCLLPLSEMAKEYALLMVGHAHLDMNWMWNWSETVSTVVATFRTMLQLMEEYPEFCFSQSQASTYKLIEDYAPELIQPIKKRIQEGRWEITASAWVETDKNMPCADSLLNHILYTKKYLSEHWGIDPDSLKLDFSPDTFGHSAFLPEIDQLGGLKYYYHWRGLDDANTILYRWRAPSGKELLSYKEPYCYNGGVIPAPAIGLPRIAKLCGGLKTGLYVYGVGDHGGGPTRRDLNRILEMQQWPIFPAIRFGCFRDYFVETESVYNNLPIIERELNPVFTGCYTTQSRIKKGNRQSENSLLRAEGLSALLSRELDIPYNSSIFETAWQKTLFTHFHDILTGSCVQESREYAMGLYQDAMSAADMRSAQALSALAKAIDTSSIVLEEDHTQQRSEGAGVGYGVPEGKISVFENGAGLTRIYHIVNPTGTPRHENVSITVWDWPSSMDLAEITTVDGDVLPCECTSGMQSYWAHEYFTIMATVDVPAYGYTTVLLKEKAPMKVGGSHIMANGYDTPCEDIVLENNYIRATFDGQTGEIFSFVDKETGGERLKEAGGLRLVHTQKTDMSAWLIGRYLKTERIEDVVSLVPIGGRLNPGFKTEYRVGTSKITSTITLGSEDRFLTVGLHIDWKEDSTQSETQPLLTYALPLTGTTPRMLCDVPAGVQWRQERAVDVPCQRYGAAETLDGRVVALITDSKYGFRYHKGTLSVSLVNTAHYPDLYAERSVHDAKLFIMTAEADGTVLERYSDACLNPLQHIPNTVHGGTMPLTCGLLELTGDTVVFSGVAQRDDRLAIRMYELAGKASSVAVTVHEDIAEAKLTDIFGNPMDIAVVIDGATVRFELPAYTMAELRI